LALQRHVLRDQALHITAAAQPTSDLLL